MSIHDRAVPKPKKSNPQKARKRKKDREYQVERERTLVRDRMRCQIGLPACRIEATMTHHVKTRAHGGGHESSNLLAVCDLCHDLIHHHGATRALAKEKGWIQ